MYLTCLKRKGQPQISTDVCLAQNCTKLVKIHNKVGDFWECEYKTPAMRVLEKRK
jgi:hypothetical protein